MQDIENFALENNAKSANTKDYTYFNVAFKRLAKMT